jgi:hypothetical protein
MDGAAIEWTREGVRGSYGRRARGERGYLGKYFVRVFESLKHPDRTPWCFAVALDTTPPPPASERFCVVVAVTECGSYEEARERGAPVVVSARYPQALLAAIDAARGESPRQRWLVEAAAQKLEREDTAAEAEAQAELTAARERAKGQMNLSRPCWSGEKSERPEVAKTSGRSRSNLTDRGNESCTRVAQRAFAR